VWSGQKAGQKEADDGGHPQPMAENKDGDGESEYVEDIP